MEARTKLELEFEIVTLINNIENNKINGARTQDLQRRLEICRAQLDDLKKEEGVAEISNSYKEKEQN